MKDLQTLATLFAAAFEERPRLNAESFYALKDGSPEWMLDAVRDAHGSFAPDDWRYSAIRGLVAAIADGADPDDMGEAIDSEVDVYTGHLTAWLASNVQRVAYCDEARHDCGAPASMEEAMQQGQYMELQEIAASLAESLRAQATKTA